MEHPIFPIIHQLCKTKKEEYGEREHNVFFISNAVEIGDSGSPVFENDYDFIGILSYK